MEQGKTNRYDFIDIGKALCIIGVVFYHLVVGTVIRRTGTPELTPGSPVEWAFRNANFLNFILPFFFFATAFTYKRGVRPVKETISRRLKTLVLPFIVIFILTIFLSSLYFWAFKGQRFTSVLAKGFLFFAWGGHYFPVEIPAIDLFANASGKILVINDFLGPFWYIQVLIPASIAFYPIVESFSEEKMGRNYHIYRGLLVIVLLALTCIEPLVTVWHLPFGLGRAPFALLAMVVGYWLKEAGLYSLKKIWVRIIVFLVAGVVVYLTGYYTGGTIIYARSEYGGRGILSILLCYLNTIAGTIVWVEICKLIALIKTKWIRKIFINLGQNSFAVYAFHMVVGEYLRSLIMLIPGNPITATMDNTGIQMAIQGVISIATIVISYYGGKALLVLINKLLAIKKKPKQENPVT